MSIYTLSGEPDTYTELRDHISKVIDTTATSLTITAASHNMRTVTISSAAPIAVTLPAATGSGNRYNFVVLVAATGTSSTIAADGTDVLQGVAWYSTTSSDNAEAFPTSATSDKVSLNGTTTGGIAGDRLEFIDVASGKWNVQYWAVASGNTATPFSAT